MAYFISINQVFAQFFQRILALYNLQLSLRGMDKGFHTGMILMDLQKAFDTLDHTVLLQKMKYVGFKESFIKWFQSDLSNRRFFVTLENVFSDAGLINCGVPQGSILRPLLFLIYMNDLPGALNGTGSYLYPVGIRRPWDVQWTSIWRPGVI